MEHAVLGDPALGEAGPSLIETQTRHCLETLKSILSEQGGSLPLVLKADVHLVNGADFYEFKLVWREYFPVGCSPPALPWRSVILCRFPGVLLNLDVVALATNSKIKREVLRDPDGPDSMKNRVGISGYSRRQFDILLGIHSERFQVRTGGRQALGISAPWRHRSRSAGGICFCSSQPRASLQQGPIFAKAIESQLYAPNLMNFHDLDAVWGRCMPKPPGRCAMGIVGLVVPGAHFVANLIVLAPDREHVKEVRTRERPIRTEHKKCTSRPL